MAKKTMKALVITIIVLFITGVGFTKGEKPKEIIPLRVSDSTTPTNFELVKKLTGKDILKEEGVILQPITVQGGEGGTVTMQALLANNLDISGGSISIWVNVISKGAKVKLVRPVNSTEVPEYSGLLALENSGIHTIKDLIGKKIAVNVLGAEADFIIRAFLKQNGLSIKQVQLVVIPAANQEQALRTGQVDAVAWTTSGGNYFDRAVENGGVRRIPGTSSYEARGNKRMLNTAEGFRTEFIRKHPDTVRAYLKASDIATRLVLTEYQKDSERVQKAYADITEEKGGNPKLAKYYRGPRWSPKDNEFITDRDILFWIDNFVKSGILKPGQIKSSDVYTNEYLPYYQK
ncbi:MAG TPA: ABC transporter substrate-binding protein [Bacillota bacterium]|nr:ABC transporter substrate-binding protein [Bacillota bacterium]